MASTTVLEQLQKSRAEYTCKWAHNATAYESGGHYGWMADQLKGYTRVLEIGTGLGHGTLALAQRGHAVVSVDENPECLAAAEARLKAASVPVRYLQRGHLRAISDKAYEATYDPVAASESLPGAGTVLLIESDVINDENLWLWLDRQQPFDAFALWNVGSHAGHQMESQLSLGNANDADYREALEAVVAVQFAANPWLRKGGVVQLVSRQLLPVDPGLLSAVAGNLHQNLCRKYQCTLQLVGHAARDYVESTDPGAMKLTVPDRSKLPAGVPYREGLSFFSILLRKP